MAENTPHPPQKGITIVDEGGELPPEEAARIWKFISSEIQRSREPTADEMVRFLLGPRIPRSTDSPPPKIGNGQEKGKTRTKQRRRKWLAEAMLLVREHPHLSDAAIAAQIGKHPSTLSRCKEYEIAAGMARASMGTKDRKPKGFRTVNESGFVDYEAFDFNEDDEDDFEDE